jgi:pre-rRNA-processing protein IPI3
MHGGLNKDGWPVMEVRPLERMRVGQRQRLDQEIGVLLGGKVDEEVLDGFDILESDLPASVGTAHVPEVKDGDDDSTRLLELEAEVTRLRSQLDRAKQINDRIWSGVVDQAFAGKKKKEGANGDVDMEG